MASSCGSDDTSGEVTTIEPSSDFVTIPTLLPPTGEYRVLTDSRLQELLAATRGPQIGDSNSPLLLPPQLSSDFARTQEGLSDDTIERLFALSREAAKRYDGEAVTSIDPNCLDADNDGLCDHLEFRFNCPRCGDLSDLPPLQFVIGADGEYEPIVPDYWNKLSTDIQDPRFIMLDDFQDDMTRRAFERVSSSAAYGLHADEAARFAPTRWRCARIPLIKFRICGPT